ncbi:MAG: molybdopterin-binding protein [Halobacteriales archaeon]|jgi:molybdopterin-binding protein
MAEVVIELPDGQRITSTITRGSADRLELAEGDEVEAVIKASEVMVDKD